MRTLAAALVAVLIVISAVEGVMVWRLRADVAALKAGAATAAGGAPAPRPARRADWADEEGDDYLPPLRREPPRPVAMPARTAAAPLGAPPGSVEVAKPSASQPLPAAIDSPEAREQMRAFVAEEMNRARNAERERWAQAREQGERDFRDQAARDLGLDAADAVKFDSILADAQTSRRQLFESMRSGEKDPASMRQEMGALRDKTDQALAALLGDDKMKQFQAMRDSQRGPGRGPGGFRP